MKNIYIKLSLGHYLKMLRKLELIEFRLLQAHRLRDEDTKIISDLVDELKRLKQSK